jgi:hypothetical protein
MIEILVVKVLYINLKFNSLWDYGYYWNDLQQYEKNLYFCEASLSLIEPSFIDIQ